MEEDISCCIDEESSDIEHIIFNVNMHIRETSNAENKYASHNDLMTVGDTIKPGPLCLDEVLEIKSDGKATAATFRRRIVPILKINFGWW